ncbi:unnamed protein product [Adineta steineri]|uniref:Uncharacterized protein n=2 Tax=Adineta steineri TaxID=433720 RepID=A0A818ZNC8_9BILA|nr:unnamed protein product [Adineta steineri]
MFAKQSHLTMPPPLWLHVDGVSLPTDIHQYQSSVRSYDYQTKHLQSPAQSPPPPPLISPTTNHSYSLSVIDGPFNHNNISKQQKILENLDGPKKLFKDRQIKKVKSLSGLIKGTALSRQTSQTSAFTSPAPSAISIQTLQDDQLPIVTLDHSDDGLPLSHTNEQQNEIRRPRVYFSDYNKIQFIEDNDEISQQHQIPINDEPRQSRIRLPSKKSLNTNPITHTTPSIQRAQTRQNLTGPTSRQTYQQNGQDLSTKKQQSNATPRTQQSHITNLPDILSQSIPNEISSHEKYTLQREKPINRLLKSTHDAPNNLAFEISSETTHNSNARYSSIQDSSTDSHKSDISDSDNGQLHIGNSPLSSSTQRQRSLLRSISLRQQFVSPTKLKSTDNSSSATTTTTNTNYNHQQMSKSLPNAQRSTSLKITTTRIHNNNNNDDLHTNGPLLTVDKRSISDNDSNKQLKRSYVIHYNSKKPLGASTANYSHVSNRHSNKSHTNEITQENFQNLLTIVQPPYAANTGTTSNKSTMSTSEDIRSSRRSSLRAPLEFNHTSNTITV